jgi:hypothetical protein
VVFHASLLFYVPVPRREAFAEVVRGLPGHWIANESPGLLPYDTLPEQAIRRPPSVPSRVQPPGRASPTFVGATSDLTLLTVSYPQLRRGLVAGAARPSPWVSHRR